MSATSAKNEVLEELKNQHLTVVTGRKPTAFDVDRWEDEASKMVTAIKTRAIPEGMEHGHQAVVIPAEEYGIVIGDDEYVYAPPADPGSYPELDGTEDESDIRRLEAEHKAAVADYYRYLGVQEHLRREFQGCMDETWIEGLQNMRGGYGHVTAKMFLDHLRSDVGQLTTREEEAMKEAIKIPWNRPAHIKKYFLKLERARAQAERWGVEIADSDVVNQAYIQMADSGYFDLKTLRDWEKKPKHEKHWQALKDYFGEEYIAITTLNSSIKGAMGSINQMQEQAAPPTQQEQMEVTEFFQELRNDALVGKEQINQMKEAFTGATTTMKEVMNRLKEANNTIKELQNNNKLLVEANKELTASNKVLAETIKSIGKGQAGAGEGGEKQQKPSQRTNPNREKCPICNVPHAKPFADYCWELPKNAHKRRSKEE